MNQQDILRFQRTAPETDGVTAPLSLNDWIKSSGLDLAFADQYIDDYSRYVNRWYISKKEHAEKETDRVKEKYQTFIKEIGINYESDSIERFIKNIDYDSDRDVETIIPLIAKALKSNIKEFTSAREDIKYQKIKYTIAGTKHGLEKIIRNIIYNVLKQPDIQAKYRAFFSSVNIKDIVNALVVNINEYIDNGQDYYDNDNANAATIRDRFQSQVFDRRILTDMDSAITSLENHQETLASSDTDTQIITSTLDPILIADTVSSSDIKFTADSYINYDITTTSNINYQTISDVMRNTIGCDQWIISVDASGEYTLGKAFSGKNNLNALSIYYPTINYIPGSNIVKESSVGMFFHPHNISIGRYYSHDIKPIILKDKLLAESSYLIPDPELYGNIYNNTSRGLDTPIDHLEDVNWVKRSIQNYGAAGTIKNSKNHSKFFGYTSHNEIKNYHERGLSWSTDMYDFWAGNNDTTWSSSDIFPMQNPYDINYEDRLRSTLPLDATINIDDALEASRHNTCTRCMGDIFGNEWILIKQTQTYDRATRDRLDVELSAEGSHVICTGSTGQDINITSSEATTKVSGTTLESTIYDSHQTLTRWLSRISSLDCREDIDISPSTVYHCSFIDSLYFITSNVPNLYVWHNQFTTLGSTGSDIQIDAGNFKDAHCDPQPTSNESLQYNINSNLSIFTLAPEYYTSTLVTGTSASDVKNDIYSKRNKSPGELWCRDSITGKLARININSSDDIVDIDVTYDILVARTDNNATYFYRIQQGSSHQHPTIVQI